MADRPRSFGTRLTHSGRDEGTQGRAVNPPVQRASTILVPQADDLYRPGLNTYGRHGTATHAALKDALCAVEGASHCELAPSGLAACALPLLALGDAGGHVLVSDNAYGPTRRFCERSLKRWGCVTEYFDPAIGAGIDALIRPETRLIFLESPGSLTFEICDAPAIADTARRRGVPTAMDNTWSAGVLHRPLDLGVDIAIQAATKYQSGAADVLLGAALTNDARLFARIADASTDLGLNVSADDAYLVLRGLRTLEVRLQRHEASGLALAEWLAARPEVAAVLHPALADHPDHALWRRDFSGASGLFGVELKPAPERAVNAFLDALKLFGLGFSWGGFESLAVSCNRQLGPRRFGHMPKGPLLRLSIGLEDPDDLRADLEAGFAALAAAG